MRVIRSAGQNVSPSDDGRLFDQAFTDGLFEEATITATGGNTITLSALYGIICGRDFTAEAQTISATLPDSDTATGYVYVEFDTSSEDIITIGTALAPFTPTYEDINTNGAVVQMVIAQYEASAVAVTSVTPTYMTATAGSVKAGSIATVEKSPAAANHSIGEFILYGGDLYEVTSAIAAGETLVVGTNIAAASIGEELTALNNGLIAEEKTLVRQTELINITVSTCYKVGNIVVVSALITVTSTISTGDFPLIKLPAKTKKRLDVGAFSANGFCFLYCGDNSDILRFNSGNMVAGGWIVNFAYAVAD